MKLYKSFVLFLMLLMASDSFASWRSAERAYSKNSRSIKSKRVIILNLVAAGNYFSSLPMMKEYLISGRKNLDSQMDEALNTIVKNVGAKQFEVLGIKFLRRSKSDAIRYILAKKYMKKRQYSKALRSLRNISRSHYFYPFAKNLEGTIESIQGNTVNASRAFKACASTVGNEFKEKLNKDYCTAGLARLSFQKRKYDQSDLLYLDIPKSSYIWPEILFEEAWNSYYLKNYNRTLGKLVSYKAPVFDYIFNPEIEVLRALAYLKLCLYKDAREVHKEFYATYYRGAKQLRRYLKKYKNSHKFFYNLMNRFEQSRDGGFDLLTTTLKNVEREVVYNDLKKQLVSASVEYERIKQKPRSRLRSRLIRDISDVIISYKKIIGHYVRAQLITSYAKLFKAFEGMSYIKLESLKKEKESLYNFEDKVTRGDVRFIERNDKQYFWTFNGEFWADELGDYVFALGSECK